MLSQVHALSSKLNHLLNHVSNARIFCSLQLIWWNWVCAFISSQTLPTFSARPRWTRETCVTQADVFGWHCWRWSCFWIRCLWVLLFILLVLKQSSAGKKFSWWEARLGRLLDTLSTRRRWYCTAASLWASQPVLVIGKYRWIGAKI